jgi:hypothetical protein
MGGGEDLAPGIANLWSERRRCKRSISAGDHAGCEGGNQANRKGRKAGGGQKDQGGTMRLANEVYYPLSIFSYEYFMPKIK